MFDFAVTSRLLRYLQNIWGPLCFPYSPPTPYGCVRCITQLRAFRLKYVKRFEASDEANNSVSEAKHPLSFPIFSAWVAEGCTELVDVPI